VFLFFGYFISLQLSITISTNDLSIFIVQGAAEITPTFRKITVGSPKQVVGCGPFRSVGYIIKFSVVAMPWSGEHRGFVVVAF
jgi:hypothetical protein